MTFGKDLSKRVSNFFAGDKDELLFFILVFLFIFKTYHKREAVKNTKEILMDDIP